MAYDLYGQKMGSKRKMMRGPKGFKTTQYEDRGGRKGDQGKRGGVGRRSMMDRMGGMGSKY